MKKPVRWDEAAKAERVENERGRTKDESRRERDIEREGVHSYERPH